MMKWVFSAFILVGSIFGLLTGRMNQVSNAILTECGAAVQLCITLTGAMCMWSGVMKIAQQSGLTEKLSRLFAPGIRLLFEQIDSKSPAAQAICLNLSANLLGLGNAATPLGIAAMKELDKLNWHRPVASKNMVMFVVLNTASLQLVPTTTALLRANAGAATPLDILPAAVMASVVSIAAGILAAKFLGRQKGESHS
jgi:Uncharacterized membrane protein, required for spore maturation in B.subtilis.